MLTREQIEEAFGDNRKAFKTKGIDHDVTVITLLRSKIPYDVCKGIIVGVGHDTLYLCDTDHVMEYLDESDLEVLADCNCWINGDNDCLALFV